MDTGGVRAKILDVEDPICPDCKHPVSSHEMFREGRCPVVRFRVAYRELEAGVMLDALKRGDVRAVRAIAAASPPDEAIVPTPGGHLRSFYDDC